MFFLREFLDWLKYFPSIVFTGEPKFPTED